MALTQFSMRGRPKPAFKIVCELLDERARQQADEGWTIENDDEQELGQLALAAAAYAIAAASREDANPALAVLARETWPYHRVGYKPKNQRRDLVRAAAMIIAEIERIDRRAAKAVKA